MEKTDRKLSRKALPVGSALILTVVLTSLLAIIGVLFVLVSRVDKMATSSISENKELNLAVESVVAKISQELALDVPGVGGQEYYDYPNVNDIWLASLEPYRDGTVYKWRQISDLYAKWDPNVGLLAEVVPDHQDAISGGVIADADGDGVADSRWVIIPEMSSGKGKSIYAAIRIIDNGAMLNANTAYKFDPNDPILTEFDIAGPIQVQINLEALGRGGDLISSINVARGLPESPNDIDLRGYERDVIWRLEGPWNAYLPFDISDELILRNRYIVDQNDTITRLKYFWPGTFNREGAYGKNFPYQPGDALSAWFDKSANADSSYYIPRHIATTYNMDRIIDPNGKKMVNVNTADINELYTTIIERLYDKDPYAVGAEQLAAQLAVNIVDLRDADAQVSILPVGSTTYYGFEAQPFISELAFRISGTDAHISANNHFAIELYNPLDADILLGDYRLEVRDSNSTVVGTINLAGYVLTDGSHFVITNGYAASRAFGVVGMSTGGGKEDPALVLATYESVEGSDPPKYVLKEWCDVYLIMSTPTGDIYLDKQKTQKEWFDWDTAVNNAQQFYARADNDWDVVYQDVELASNTLGNSNGLDVMRKNYNFYNFANALERFASVGDIARALIIGPSTDPDDMIGVRLDQEPPENLVRFNLQDPNYTNIFQYLTVIDPTEHIDPNNYTDYQSYLDETRIKGRININTAPWFVIAQLPWMQPEIAQAITAYRETVTAGFESIADLIQVPEMQILGNDGLDNLLDDTPRGPDVTEDTARDDFEERDLIFSRISNLVTVRSDVFTAYILVRIGVDGPQKRVLAILDRSRVTSPTDKVRILALHPVPDPR